MTTMPVGVKASRPHNISTMAALFFIIAPWRLGYPHGRAASLDPTAALREE